MKTMKAARIYGPGDLKIVDVPVPDIGPNDVLCKVVCAGICGTDYSIYTGEASFVKSGAVKFDKNLGHEWSGIVEKIGDKVGNFKPGDRVVGDTAISCGQCYDCLMGEYNHCKSLKALGTVGSLDGCFAEYMKMPERHLFHLPDNVSFEQGALIEPTATALFSVVQADVSVGDTTLVIGSGPIGIAAARLAKTCGASKVVIVGRKKKKLETSILIGVDGAIDTNQVSLADGVKEHFSDGTVDRVIEASGSNSLFSQSLDLINPGGTISLVAFYDVPLENLLLDKLVFGDITIKPVAGSLGMYRPTLRLMKSGTIDLSPMINGTCSFEEIPEVISELKTKHADKIKIIAKISKDI